MPDEDDLELDTETSKGKSGLVKIIIIAVVALLVLGGTIAATLYFAGVFDGGEDEAVVEEMEGEGKEDKAKEKKKAKKDSKPKDTSIVIYHEFDPAFVVNFEDNNVVRFLQIGMSALTHDQTVINELNKHDPAIRNNLVLLFSSQTYEELSSREGKEALRKKALKEIQGILKENTGDPGVEQIYFTSFVIQ